MGSKPKIDYVLKRAPKAPMPGIIKPQLATLVDKPPQGDEWLHEIKLDGYRMIAFVNKSDIRIITRRGQDWTSKFTNVVKALNKLNSPSTVFDGEIVILDKHQRSDFQLLQNAIHDNAETNFIYYIFDLIHYDGRDLTKIPLIERKNILHQLVPSATGANLRYSDHISGSGKEIFKKSCELGLEGIISKRADSPYIQKRTPNWLKIKCVKRQEFVIGGYTEPKKSREYFGSILVGVYDDKETLEYRGRVGTGFDEKSLEDVYRQLLKNKSSIMPFAKTPPDIKEVSWTKPVLIAEVEYRELTRDGILRQPSFKGLRSDKNPKTISMEEAKPVKTYLKKEKSRLIPNVDLKITNPDKVLYEEEGITKLEVIEYYNAVHKKILPYITERPLSLFRCPDGYNKEPFYQKHFEDEAPKGIYKIPIKEKHKTEDYLYIKDVHGLLMLGQLGTIEIHPWGSKIKNVEKPDTVIFDLDPAPDVPWAKVAKAAFDIKKYLKQLKLKCFLKSTGGKGLHVVIPIKPEYDWHDVKTFAHAFMTYIVMENPDEFSSKMTKIRRIGKIYIDYLRNQRGATAVAPYSLRANKMATVAAPINWDELTNNIKDTTYTIKTMPERLKKLKKDPWQDYFSTKQSLRLEKFL